MPSIVTDDPLIVILPDLEYKQTASIKEIGIKNYADKMCKDKTQSLKQ